MSVIVSDAKCVQYEMEIAIAAPREKTWQALIQDIARWWLPDFHMVQADSEVVFDTTAGGRGLVELRPDGSGLQWYAVQYYMPEQFTIHLVGHIAPDWGGPATSHMKLSLEETSDGCLFKLHDAQHGNVSEATIGSLSSGWKNLFTNGLKSFVESGDITQSS